MKDPTVGQTYPSTIDTPGRRAIFDTVDGDETLALQIDETLHLVCQDGWRTSRMKTRRVNMAVRNLLQDAVGEDAKEMTETVVAVAKEHHEY